MELRATLSVVGGEVETRARAGGAEGRGIPTVGYPLCGGDETKVREGPGPSPWSQERNLRNSPLGSGSEGRRAQRVPVENPRLGPARGQPPGRRSDRNVLGSSL